MKKIEIQNFAPLSYAGQEAVNTLCTNISFSGENVRKIMLTSSHASEGKSFLAMNVMRTLAKYGKSVVLVDADMRRSYIGMEYGLKFEDEENAWGLVHLLAGMTNEASIVYETNIEGACIVPVGRQVSNPLPLLNSSHFENLLNHLAEVFDYVLVDAPPVGLVIDAAEIARYCDGTLLVVNYNQVRRNELVEAKMQLEQTGCPIIGAVLNQVEYDNYINRKYYYKKYYSGYNYHRDDKEAKARRKAKR